ncbi:MAG: hypothetical protein JST22_20160 [Bacteroidetes bacterium]|nr:hypothetical protein [Bacteroidota bacterium]
MAIDWAWLAGTFWYVPRESLPAPAFVQDSEQPLWLTDQTVWWITGYRDGYFWGYAAVQLHPPVPGSANSAPAGQRLMGSVTPEGAVHITFIASDAESGRAPTIGLGTMRWREPEWRFEMQMSDTVSGATVLHWAWMMQCVPGGPFWICLPGTDVSLPEFLNAAGITPQF